jgi:hypothetical protein
MKPTKPTSHGAHHHYSPEELHNEGVAHEHADIDIRAITIFLGLMFAMCGVVALLMGGLFKLLEYRAAQNDPQLSPIARPASVMPPTTTGSATFGVARGPQLLTNEPIALEHQRQVEREVAQEYAWVNKGAGVARIPIEEAKKLIAERGLPVRQGGAPPEIGTTLPARGESSSGRIVNGPPRGAGLPEIPGTGAASTAPAPTPHKEGGH